MDDLILFVIIVLGGMLLIACFFIKTLKQCKCKLEKQEGAEITSDQPEYTTTTVNATVADVLCYTKTVGIKMQKIVKEFAVVFRTEDGNVLKIIVPEEMYDGFEKGQTGILSLVDGEIYGFELTE